MTERPGTGLALIGYRGTGKTTVGRIVAARSGRPFADADAEVERRTGRTIADIFRDEGEPSFRDHEAAVLADLTGRDGLVLACGGGAVLSAANRRALRRFGPVVWLTAPAATLADRLAVEPGDRPSLTPAGLLDEIAAVLDAREALYRETADVRVDTEGRSPEDLAGDVLAAWSSAAVAGDFRA